MPDPESALGTLLLPMQQRGWSVVKLCPCGEVEGVQQVRLLPALLMGAVQRMLLRSLLLSMPSTLCH